MCEYGGGQGRVIRQAYLLYDNDHNISVLFLYRIGHHIVHKFDGSVEGLDRSVLNRIGDNSCDDYHYDYRVHLQLWS